MAEQKIVMYNGIDVDDVTEKFEEGQAKLAAKGWETRKIDMLGGATLQVTYVRGPEDDEEEEDDE